MGLTYMIMKGSGWWVAIECQNVSQSTVEVLCYIVDRRRTYMMVNMVLRILASLWSGLF
jgi:hypothetical protein